MALEAGSDLGTTGKPPRKDTGMSIAFEPLATPPRGSDEVQDLAPLQNFQRTLSLATGLSLAVVNPAGSPLAIYSHPSDHLHSFLLKSSTLVRALLAPECNEFRVIHGPGGLLFMRHPIRIREVLFGHVLAGPVWEAPPGSEELLELSALIGLPSDQVESAIRFHPAPVPLDLSLGRELTASLAELSGQLLHDRRQQRHTLTTLASLYEIGTAISSSLDLEEVLSTVLSRSVELFGATTGSLILLDEVRGELKILAQDAPDDTTVCTSRIPLGEDASAWVAREGQPRIGGGTDNGHLRVPLKVKDRCIGVIHVGPRHDRTAYTIRDLQVLGILSSHAASAVDNAQLYSRVTRQVRELEALQEVGHSLNSSLDVPETLRQVLDRACDLLEATNASVMLLEPDGRHLRIRVARGLPDEVIQETRVRLGERISGRVAQEGLPISLPGGVDAQGEEIAPSLSVPLKADNKVVGVLNVRGRPHAEEFTRDDVDLATRLASISAAALENAELHDELQQLLIDSITALANAIDARDPYTRGHSERVTEYSVMLGEKMGFAPDEIERLRYAALLHDIGKIRIPDHILNKPGRLDDTEYEEMKRHPVYGVGIMLPVRAFRPLLPYMLHHHERFDGMGYPDRKMADEIPLAARIICVADCFDAMTSDRPYRKGLAVEVAIEELQKNKGTQFDPEVVELMLGLIAEGKLDPVLEKMRAQASVSSLLGRRAGGSGGVFSGLVGRGRLAGLPGPSL